MSHHTDQWPSPDGATGSEPHRAAERTEPGDVPASRDYAEGTPFAACTFSVSIRSRYRPMWRWLAIRALVASRLPVVRLTLALAHGARAEISIEGGPWERLIPVSDLLTTEAQ